MGDMLIRGIDPGLKRYLEASAKRNGRSLSEEAIAMLRRAAAVERATMEGPGDRLRALVGDAYFTDEEIEAIAASRREPDRVRPVSAERMIAHDDIADIEHGGCDG